MAQLQQLLYKLPTDPFISGRWRINEYLWLDLQIALFAIWNFGLWKTSSSSTEGAENGGKEAQNGGENHSFHRPFSSQGTHCNYHPSPSGFCFGKVAWAYFAASSPFPSASSLSDIFWVFLLDLSLYKCESVEYYPILEKILSFPPWSLIL